EQRFLQKLRQPRGEENIRLSAVPILSRGDARRPGLLRTPNGGLYRIRSALGPHRSKASATL
ncbi:MAG: hypothetical protein, partial [Olavius algarvensis Gamma 3 endosymbiont]